jgi:hypothetical protein
VLLWLFALCVGPEPREPANADDAQQDAWAAAGWGAPEPSEPEPSEAAPGEPEPSEPEPSEPAPELGEPGPESERERESEAADRVKVGDVLSGSMRLTGSFLHFDDEPALFPNGDDALLLTVGRVLLEADAGEHVHVSFNGFGELSRVPFGAGSGGTYNEDNGGAFGAAVASLRWQLLNDTGGKAKGHFVGDPCGLCADANWKTDSRAMR